MKDIKDIKDIKDNNVKVISTWSNDFYAIIEALDFIARDCEEYGENAEATRYDLVAKKLVNGELKLVEVEK